METMDKHVAFVKEQLRSQEEMAKKYAETPYRANRHLATAHKFTELLEFLEAIQRNPDQALESGPPKNVPKQLALTLNDIEDLPEELIRELNLTETDRQELLIEDIITRSGGILSLDKLMVVLYRRTGEIPKRNTLTSRLYRMAQRGVIFNVPGKKGVYSTYELTEQDVRRLFGSIDGEAVDN